MLDLSKSKLSKAKVKGKSRRWLRSSSYAAGRDTVLLNTNVQSTNAPIHQNKTKVRRKVTFFFKKRVFLLSLFLSTLALRNPRHTSLTVVEPSALTETTRTSPPAGVFTGQSDTRSDSSLFTAMRIRASVMALALDEKR